MNLSSEKIWLDHNKELSRFILSKVKDKDICNDVMQDVFIKIHTNINTLKNETRLTQWVYQITRNIINDHFRKKKPSINTHTIDLPEQITKTNSTHQFSKCLNSFVKHLPNKYKEAITLVELQNLSQLQLADKLKISYSAAKSRVQRARELLKMNFYKCCHVSTDKYGNVISFLAKNTCGVCQI